MWGTYLPSRTKATKYWSFQLAKHLLKKEGLPILEMISYKVERWMSLSISSFSLSALPRLEINEVELMSKAKRFIAKNYTKSTTFHLSSFSSAVKSDVAELREGFSVCSKYLIVLPDA